MILNTSNFKEIFLNEMKVVSGKWEFMKSNATIYNATNFSVFVGDFYFDEDTIINVKKDKPTVVLFFNLSGDRVTTYNDITTNIDLKSGQHNLLFTQNNNNKLYFTKQIRHKSLVIYFEPDFFTSLTEDSNSQLNDELLNAISKEIPKMALQNNKFINPRMNIVIQELILELNTNKNPLYIKSLIYRLLYFQLEELSASVEESVNISSSDREKIEAVRKILINELNYRITVKEISQNVGLNTTKLKALFSKTFGTSIKKYQLSFRMEQAKNRLLTSDLSISEIAYEAGYEYPEHFTRSFKNHFGYPPINLRKTIF